MTASAMEVAIEMIAHCRDPFHVPIDPISVKVPVTVLIPYIETSFEPEFVT
jgi:hypothetical protein